MIDCREIVDQVKLDANIAIKTSSAGVNTVVLGKVCDVCTELQAEFAKNPGGVPPKGTGLILAGILGGDGIAITTICLLYSSTCKLCVCLMSLQPLHS